MSLWQLKAFCASQIVEKVSVSIEREDQVLRLNYQVDGDLSGLKIPFSRESQGRGEGLWQQTCFEVFLAQPNEDQYWECNFSPNGAWNTYHFTGYREGMRESEDLIQTGFLVKKEERQLTLQVDLEASFLGSQSALEVAPSVVLEDQSGQYTYWAIEHSKEKPDFHCRKHFEMLRET